MTDAFSLDNLEVFLEVVVAGSRNRAAKKLGMNQSTVSRKLKSVVDYFGGALFESEAPLKLSNRGLRVKELAERLFRELADTRRCLDPGRQHLRIGFVRAMQTLVQRALRALPHTGADAISVLLFELTSDLGVSWLNSRKLDVLVCFECPEFSHRDDVVRVGLSKTPHVLVVPENAVLSGELSTEALRALAYVHSRRSDLVRAGDRWLHERAVAPVTRIECEVANELVSYAAAGRGFGFVPACAAYEQREGVTVVAAASLDPMAQISVYTVSPVLDAVRSFSRTLTHAAARGFDR